MPVEHCGICGTQVPLGDAAHLLVNPPDGSVTDYYVCLTCHRTEVAPLLDLGE